MPDNDQLALPLGRRSRAEDPDTSIAAALKAHGGSPEAVRMVRTVMSDGAMRTDEELYLACLRAGCHKTASAIRHARLVCAEAGLLRDTGARRNTSTGSAARVWIATRKG